MRQFKRASTTLCVVVSSFFAVLAMAAEPSATETTPTASANTEVPPSPAKNAPDKKDVTAQKQTAAENEPKKMVQGATINLQTTVTGNQEQPRVLYILPWQSPQTENVDFETMDNQQKAVFGHVERDELRRELESSEHVEKN